MFQNNHRQKNLFLEKKIFLTITKLSPCD